MERDSIYREYIPRLADVQRAPTNKEALRIQLATEVREFLKRGGKVNTVPFGVSAETVDPHWKIADVRKAWRETSHKLYEVRKNREATR